MAAVHQGDLVGEIGKEQRFFHRGVAAADHGDFLASEEEAVAGGAGRNAKALKLAFAGQAQPVGASAGGDDQRVGGIDLAAVARQREGPARKIDGGDGVGDEFGAQMLRLLLHLIHQPGALDGVGEARIILHLGCDCELAAGLDAGDQGRLQHGARGIDRGRASGRAAAQNDDLGMMALHGFGGGFRAKLRRPVISGEGPKRSSRGQTRNSARC